MKLVALSVLSALVCTACASSAGTTERDEGRRIGTGLVVEYGLAGPDISEKAGLAGVSDKDVQLFAAAVQRWGRGGQSTSTFVGGRLPKTVRVTWRTDTEPGRYWTTGRVIGDHLVEVDRRLPEDVIRYANAAPGRALRLLFRIKDDGVLFGWDVEERFGGLLVNTMRGGDVPCYDTPRAANAMPTCTTGPLVDAPWYSPQGFRH